jgi:WD40 repeat protein
VILWDGETGVPSPSFAEEGDVLWLGEVAGLAVSPDGRCALAAGTMNSPQLWSLGAGGRKRVFRGYEGTDLAVAFRADSRRAWTSGPDRALWLWDVGTGRVVRAYAVPDGSVTAMASSPAGDTLLLVTGDAVLVWTPPAE